MQKFKMSLKIRKMSLKNAFMIFLLLILGAIFLPFDSRHRRRNDESRTPHRLVILDEPSIVTFVVNWCGSDHSTGGEPRWWNVRNCESAISTPRLAGRRYPYSSIRLNLKVSVTRNSFSKSISGNTIYHFIHEILS